MRLITLLAGLLTVSVTTGCYNIARSSAWWSPSELRGADTSRFARADAVVLRE